MVVVPGPENPMKWVKNAPKVLGHDMSLAFAHLDIGYILNICLMTDNPLECLHYKCEQWKDDVTYLI